MELTTSAREMIEPSAAELKTLKDVRTCSAEHARLALLELSYLPVDFTEAGGDSVKVGARPSEDPSLQFEAWTESGLSGSVSGARPGELRP